MRARRTISGAIFLVAGCAAPPRTVPLHAPVERAAEPGRPAIVQRAPAETPEVAPVDPPDTHAAERAFAERTAWRARLHWSTECDEGFPPDAGEVGVEETELGGGRSLVRVSCERGGYNFGMSWFWVERARGHERVRALSFPTYEVPNEQTTRAITSPILRGIDELDVAKREIRVWRKFRGVGDCGLTAVYGVEGGKVRVRDIRAKLACDGESPGKSTLRRLPIPRVR